MSTQVIVERVEDVLSGTWTAQDFAPEVATEVVITNERGTNTFGAGPYC